MGTRVSKRVRAPELQDEPTRVTRQKTIAMQQAPNLTLTSATQDSFVSASSPTHHDDHEDLIHISDEGALTTSTERRQRGRSMGRDLDRISRGLCSKMEIHIFEEKRRPEAPMQAAKLASEGSIYQSSHWNNIKKNMSHITNYISKVVGHFTMDTNSKAVTNACIDMLKGGQKQLRYRLKKKHFNGIPANEVTTISPVKCMTNEEWGELVAMWSDSKHKDKCSKNQQNREKVQFQQRTGSRCYIAYAHVVKQEKYKDVEPTAFDLFKEVHCSKKVDFSEPVKKAIVDIEAIMLN